MFEIRKYREELGLTQAELAQRSGVTRLTIISLENNPNYVATTKTILSVAQALGKKVGDIFFCESEVEVSERCFKSRVFGRKN